MVKENRTEKVISDLLSAGTAKQRPLEIDGRHQGSRALASTTIPIGVPCPVGGTGIGSHHY
jgi:hypothetical protein